MIFWNRRQMLILAAVAPLATSRRAIAAAYPDRPVRIVIPYTAGGVAETLIRLLATKIEPRLGQKLVIEAKPGAAGNIGTLDVAYATPDGYTLLVAATNNYVINQYMTKMPVDPLTALAPVAKVADVPLVLFTNKQVPFRTFSEMIDFARAHPGKLSYGVPSLGTVNHLLMERLKQTAGLDITAIPYRGSPQATLALLSNDIQLYPIGLAAGIGSMRDGKIAALAVATEQRLPVLPQVPTIQESGFPGFVASNWWGMGAPKGTPEAVLEIWHDAVIEALKDPAIAKRLDELGMVPRFETRAQLTSGLAAEAGLWREVVTRGKLSAQ